MRWLERGVQALSVAWLATACGGSEAPAKQLADTQASIRAAEEVGATQTPEAALQLKKARDGLARAERLNANDDHDQAKVVLHEAELDAELAVLLAKQEASEAKALQAKRRVEGLGSAKSTTDDERPMP